MKEKKFEEQYSQKKNTIVDDLDRELYDIQGSMDRQFLHYLQEEEKRDLQRQHP